MPSDLPVTLGVIPDVINWASPPDHLNVAIDPNNLARLLKNTNPTLIIPMTYFLTEYPLNAVLSKHMVSA
jgi:hypothetical protein